MPRHRPSSNERSSNSSHSVRAQSRSQCQPQSNANSNTISHIDCSNDSNTNSNADRSDDSKQRAHSEDDEIVEETLVRQNHTNGVCLWPRDYRVKLYKLHDDGLWGDEGTGTIHFALSHSVGGQSIDIQVVTECDPESVEVEVADGVPTILLQHTAQSHILYEKQGESIIQWLDSTVPTANNTERAISFQHQDKCLELWRLIAFIKGHRKISEFEAENRRHKDQQSPTDEERSSPSKKDRAQHDVPMSATSSTTTSTSTSTASTSTRDRHNAFGADPVDTMDPEENDVEMNESNDRSNDSMVSNGSLDSSTASQESSGSNDSDILTQRTPPSPHRGDGDCEDILQTFLDDHHKMDGPDHIAEYKEDPDMAPRRRRDVDGDHDMNINIKMEYDDDDEHGVEMGLSAKPQRLVKVERPRKSKKKKKRKNKSKASKRTYFDRDRHRDRDDRSRRRKAEEDEDSDSDGSDSSDNESRSTTIDTSSDEDEYERLQRLTMRTSFKSRKRKSQIPMPTEDNLCEVFDRVKTAMQNKDMAALQQIGQSEFRETLYSVFLKIENNINSVSFSPSPIAMRHTLHPPLSPPPPPAKYMDIDGPECPFTFTGTTPPAMNITESNDNPTTALNGDCEAKTPDGDDHVASDHRKRVDSKSPRAENGTPRLSTASLSTLPPSVECEEDELSSVHPLELVFMIVLECCREHQPIKQNRSRMKKDSASPPRGSLSSRFAAIKNQPLPFMMQTSLAQLLNGSLHYNSPRNGASTPLMMLFLGKSFISKTIAMLEYDPVRGMAARKKVRTATTSPSRSRRSVGSNASEETLRISVSRRHRDYLKKAKPRKLGITMKEQETLDSEIEYVYKLNYVRDCILLGKLDLEQQSFHIINHHLGRYNSLICETISDDEQFVKALLAEIKRSCSKHYGIVPRGDETEGTETAAMKMKMTGDAMDSDLSITAVPDEKTDDDNDVAGNMTVTVKSSKTKDTPNGDAIECADAVAPTSTTTTTTTTTAALNGHRILSDDHAEESDPNLRTPTRAGSMMTRGDGGFGLQMRRRKMNRTEMYNAPDGVLFRFLSEFLARTKAINEMQTRCQIFSDLIDHGLLDTLSACISGSRVLPTDEFAHIWLVLVECLHHMISAGPCSNAPKVREFIVSQIKTFELNTDRVTLLQRLCAAFNSDDYVLCANDGILDQIYFVVVGILGLGDMMGMDNGGQLSYMSMGPDRDLKASHLKVIGIHFFEDCLPLFYQVLSSAHSKKRIDIVAERERVSGTESKHRPYHQIKTMQKLVIDLLSECCQQEQFLLKLKAMEERYDLMSSIHSLIYVPKRRSDGDGDGDRDRDANGGGNSGGLRYRARTRSVIANKDLSMCCIRFLRECMYLGQHDQFWCDRFKSRGLFRNILALFDANGLDTDNMLNSVILSVFSNVEDKKISELIVYLGDERILERYSKLIGYTTKFGDLLKLYEIAKEGDPIDVRVPMDEGSTTTVSNCSSLSPRMSPSGLSPQPQARMNGDTGAWQNEPDREEIHYFNDDDDEDHDDDGNPGYALDDGAGGTVLLKQREREREIEREEEHETATNGTTTNVNIGQSDDVESTSTPDGSDRNRCDEMNGHRHDRIHQDSPRPLFGALKKKRKELKLPVRKKEDDGFDLMANARRLKKREEAAKRLTLKIKDQDKESSPFLNELSKAMDLSTDSSPFSNGRKSIKRKFKDISMERTRSEDGDVWSASVSEKSDSPQKKKQKLSGPMQSDLSDRAMDEDVDGEKCIRLSGPNGMTINIKTKRMDKGGGVDETQLDTDSESKSNSSWTGGGDGQNHKRDGMESASASFEKQPSIDLELGIPDKDDEVLLPPSTRKERADTSNSADSEMTRQNSTE